MKATWLLLAGGALALLAWILGRRRPAPNVGIVTMGPLEQPTGPYREPPLAAPVALLPYDELRRNPQLYGSPSGLTPGEELDILRRAGFPLE